MTMTKLTLILSTVSLLILSCQQANIITNKDDQGRVTEKYNINDDSLKHGLYEAYINGAKVEEAHYDNGKLQGTRKIYRSNGAIEIEEQYDNNVISGKYKTFHLDGTLSQEANYVDGVMQGELKSYYQNKQLKEVVTMVNNEENGPFVEYHENGQKSYEGNYLNGENEYGLLQQYDESGVLIKKMTCDSLGVCTTIWTLKDGDIAPAKTK